MSLHCPATLVVARAEGDSPALAERVRHRNVAGVFTGTEPELALAGRTVGAVLATPVATMPELDPGASGPPATVKEALVQLDDVLHSLADLHRGETVVVLTKTRSSADWVVFEVEIGDDGVRLVG